MWVAVSYIRFSSSVIFSKATFIVAFFISANGSLVQSLTQGITAVVMFEEGLSTLDASTLFTT